MDRRCERGVPTPVSGGSGDFSRGKRGHLGPGADENRALARWTVEGACKIKAVRRNRMQRSWFGVGKGPGWSKTGEWDDCCRSLASLFPTRPAEGAPSPMNHKEIYLVFTRTGTWLSRMICIIFRMKYPHVSISFDDSLTRMYSFGRRSPDNPFSGGLVEENLQRWCFPEVSRQPMPDIPNRSE